MFKKIVFLLLSFSITCFANKTTTCFNVSKELSQPIRLMITSICDSDYFNKNIRFITNTTNVDADEWIKKAFFIIIDKKSNTVLSPYNTIFKQIAILPTAFVEIYRNFIKHSSSEKLPNYNWLQKVNNISSLMSSDVNAINNMFNNTSNANLQKDIASFTASNTTIDNSVVTLAIKNSTTGVFDCEHIDHHTITLGCFIMIENICASDYFNKNIRFITSNSRLSKSFIFKKQLRKYLCNVLQSSIFCI